MAIKLDTQLVGDESSISTADDGELAALIPAREPLERPAFVPYQSGIGPIGWKLLLPSEAFASSFPPIFFSHEHHYNDHSDHQQHAAPRRTRT